MSSRSSSSSKHKKRAADPEFALALTSEAQPPPPSHQRMMPNLPLTQVNPNAFLLLLQCNVLTVQNWYWAAIELSMDGKVFPARMMDLLCEKPEAYVLVHIYFVWMLVCDKRGPIPAQCSTQNMPETMGYQIEYIKEMKSHFMYLCSAISTLLMLKPMLERSLLLRATACLANSTTLPTFKQLLSLQPNEAASAEHINEAYRHLSPEQLEHFMVPTPTLMNYA